MLLCTARGVPKQHVPSVPNVYHETDCAVHAVGHVQNDLQLQQMQLQCLLHFQCFPQAGREPEEQEAELDNQAASCQLVFRFSKHTHTHMYTHLNMYLCKIRERSVGARCVSSINSSIAIHLSPHAPCTRPFSIKPLSIECRFLIAIEILLVFDCRVDHFSHSHFPHEPESPFTFP